MRKQVWTAIFVVVLQFAVAIYLYPSMPESMAIHWGTSGTADGYGSRIMGLFSMPIVSAVLLPLLLILPRFDPSKGLNKFQEGYSWFVLGFTAYMAYIFGLSLAYNLGWTFDFGRMLAPVFGLGLYGLGVLMGKAKLNWFWGIKTPWTLSNEAVWDSTHALGGRLFKVSSILALAGSLVGGWISLLLMLVPIMGSTVYLLYYSYAEFQSIHDFTRFLAFMGWYSCFT